MHICRNLSSVALFRIIYLLLADTTGEWRAWISSLTVTHTPTSLTNNCLLLTLLDHKIMFLLLAHKIVFSFSTKFTEVYGKQSSREMLALQSWENLPTTMITIGDVYERTYQQHNHPWWCPRENLPTTWSPLVVPMRELANNMITLGDAHERTYQQHDHPW